MKQFELQKPISQLFGAQKSLFLLGGGGGCGGCAPFSYGSFRTPEQNHYLKKQHFVTSSLHHSIRSLIFPPDSFARSLAAAGPGTPVPSWPSLERWSKTRNSRSPSRITWPTPRCWSVRLVHSRTTADLELGHNPTSFQGPKLADGPGNEVGHNLARAFTRRWITDSWDSGVREEGEFSRVHKRGFELWRRQ